MEKRVPGEPSLAACLIVRNEAHALDECLRSLEGHVDAIYVTDTGSTDASIKVARAWGAKVRSFEWCNDFAAARNASIADVEEDWILVVDADDRFPASEAARLRRQLRSDACAATLLYSAVPGYTPLHATRLLRNGLGAVFTGRIHENVDNWVWEQRRQGRSLLHLDVNLLHTGYTPEALPRKLERNLPLLEEEWRSLGASSTITRRLFIAAELGVALTKSHRRSEAVTLLQDCVDKIFSGEAALPPAGLQLVINLAWMLSEGGNAVSALNLVRDVETFFGKEPAYFLHRGLHELAASNYPAARTYLETFRNAWESGDFSVPVPIEYIGANWWRAMGLCHMGEQRYSQAEDCFEVCCELEPHNPEYQLRRLVAGRMCVA